MTFHQKYLSSSVLAITAFGALLLCAPSQGLADSLGADLATFAVLASGSVTNASGTGNPTVITGNLGSATAVTGFPPGIVNGTINPGDVAAAQGQLITAFNTLSGLANTGGTITAGGLTGATLTPGVYTVTSTAIDLAGALTLDATGNPTGSWVFQMSSSLTTGSGASVNLTGFGAGNSVYWIAPSFTTLGDNTSFAGNILAMTLITFDPGAQDLCGRALSRTGDPGVTFAGANPATTDGRPNLVGGGCSASGGLNGGGGNGTGVPEPATLLLLGSGLAGIAAWRRKQAA